ncbi:hypothetical protein [Streptomyces sp. NBC_00448]
MIAQSPLTTATGPVLIWDTSPLLHAIKAEKTDVLHDFAPGATGRGVT